MSVPPFHHPYCPAIGVLELVISARVGAILVVQVSSFPVWGIVYLLLYCIISELTCSPLDISLSYDFFEQQCLQDMYRSYTVRTALHPRFASHWSPRNILVNFIMQLVRTQSYW